MAEFSTEGFTTACYGIRKRRRKGGRGKISMGGGINNERGSNGVIGGVKKRKETY